MSGGGAGNDAGVLLTLEVWCPPPPADFKITVLGSIPLLGGWDPTRPVMMDLIGEGVWRLKIEVPRNAQFDYKYACFSTTENRCVGFEQGQNRFLSIPQKLAQEPRQIDEASGSQCISVKDVWSSAPAQPQMMQPQMVQPQYGRLRSASPALYAPQYSPMMHPQMYGYGAPYQPQMQLPPRQSSQMMRQTSFPGVAEAAAGMVQQQLMQDRMQPAVQQPAQQPRQNDPQLNARLTKVVGEVSALKKKLKESQREKHDQARLHKAAEEKYESDIKTLKHRVRALEEDLQLAKQAREEIQAKALEQGKSAAAAEVVETLNAEMATLKARAAQAEKALKQENHEIREQLQRTRAEAFDTREQVNKLENDLGETQDELRQSHDVIANCEKVLKTYASLIKKAQTQALVSDPLLSFPERLGFGFAYFEEESRKSDPSIFFTMMNKCKQLRAEFERQKLSIQAVVAQEVSSAIKTAHHQMRSFVCDLEKEKISYQERYQRQYNERRKLANQIVDLKGKIRVFGRARPFIERERQAGHTNVVAFPEQNRLLIGLGAEQYLLVNDVDAGQDTELGKNRIEDVKMYELDHIFPPSATQEQVFEELRLLIASVMDGFNVTVFAYGQTGSGKTFTMDGTPEQPGITYRSLGIIFDSKEFSGEAGRLKRKPSILKPRVEVEISMLEIYNEEIRDLLDESDFVKRPKLEIKQSADGGSYVAGLTRVSAPNLKEALEIMDRGRENRKTACTKMNTQSSRSHMVFTAYVTVTNPTTKDKAFSKLHLVDLAGSERVSKTGASGEQLKEAMAINKSLSALGDVVASLTATDRGHVPYRNSKLTFLLQDSLCGNSRTAMFVNLSPSSDNYWETISTLNFGARAASVELGQVQKNFESGENTQLRDQLLKLQAQLANVVTSAGGASDELNDARRRISELEKEGENKDKKVKLLATRTEELTKQIEQQELTLDKKLDRLRADLKQKDETVKDLEDQLKKAKKESTSQRGATTAEVDAMGRDLAATKKQLAELQKTIKQLEVKLQTAESKTKKAEGSLTKTEEELEMTKQALTKAKEKAKADLEALRREFDEGTASNCSGTPRSTSALRSARLITRPVSHSIGASPRHGSEANGSLSNRVSFMKSPSRQRVEKNGNAHAALDDDFGLDSPPRTSIVAPVSRITSIRGRGYSADVAKAASDSSTPRTGRKSVREIRQGAV